MRRFVRQWRKRYPCPVVWVDDRANKQYRRSEAQWLAQFDGVTALKRREVRALVAWAFPHEEKLAVESLSAIEAPAAWGHARRRIKDALKEKSPTGALDLLTDQEQGIPGWGPTMASVVLAACRPDIYAIAHDRPLRTLRLLGLHPPDSDSFTRLDWYPYLRTCRQLAERCNLSLRAVGQALWAAADEAPKLPERPNRPARRRDRSG